MKLAISLLLLAGACATTEQLPDDPVRHNQRGLRQSPQQGEGLGNDHCANGCPEPDTDGDGITDDHDACPKEADTDPVDRAYDGCPDDRAED